MAEAVFLVQIGMHDRHESLNNLMLSGGANSGRPLGVIGRHILAGPSVIANKTHDPANPKGPEYHL